MMVIYWNTTIFNNVAIYVGVESVPEVRRISRNETQLAVNTHYKNFSKLTIFANMDRFGPAGNILFDGEKLKNYAFDLPLSVRAWHQVGCDCIVLIINDPRVCKKDSKVRFLMETLLDMDGMVLLILNGTQENILFQQVKCLDYWCLI